MLPHECSSDICSLKEGQVRAALACHLHVEPDGTLKSWRFSRAKICVAANIAYENAQAAIDGTAGLVEPQLVESALKPLWECWKALLAARNKREPLELDLPERRVVLDEKGRILSVAPRERLDAHRLVEDYMIAANVAAAKALEKKKAPVMYRIHEAPGREKLVALKDYLATFGVEFALGQVIKPGTFNHILARVGEHDARPEIMEQVLRTQMQARYGPEPLGHFGLALGSYAHFTSPIRRYADLLVHRALVTSYKLGDGGLPPSDIESFSPIGEAISILERRAMEAERETVDRYVAAFLADRVGQILACRISGVQPFGFFATVEGLGGDGLVLAATLGREYFRYDEKARALVGDDSGETYRQGQKVELKLVEANPASGSLRFELPQGGVEARPSRDGQRRDRVRGGAGRGGPGRDGPQKRGRPANIRHQGGKR
jgi:ribonuclease R